MSHNPILTIGYGTRTVDTFMTLLQTHAVAFLIDVRSQPYSRHQPDFAKAALAGHLAVAGIRYVFMGHNLGGRPDDPDCYRQEQVDYEKLTQKPFYRAGIERLQAAFRQGERVALLCAEAKPEMCHRAHLIGRSLTAVGVPVLHIDEDGRLLSQEAVLARLNGGQMPLLPQTNTAVMPPPPPNFDDDFVYDPVWAAEDDIPAGTWAPPALPPPVPYDDPLAALKQVFGYDAFRPLQQEIITGLLAGQDALAVMPTGSGKSLCYQLPALLQPGLTVVVSPLISLMADQVMQLRELGVTAVTLNSSMSHPEQQWTVAQIRQGAVKLLYAAPETLVKPEILALLESVPVACLTIDEAHCISEWGHDFRPEYRQLVELRRRLPTAVCLAVTATATERVRQDIKRSLSIPAAAEFMASFNRENLYLAVAPKTDTLAQTIAFLQEHRDESGIIYCATRRHVDELAAQLQGHGWPVLPYHAGLDDGTRHRHQEQFSRDDVPIMVATIAFGMGINKPNVRFILHVDLPKNLESYYQQIGRAGRDGLRADCLLLYSYGDVQTINYFISQQEAGQQLGAKMRLEAMLGFVETAVCRRRPLLAYFNETYAAESCDLCDNCTTSGGELVDLTIPAQKFLSCVKRTGEIFGVNHIIDVLRGSRSQKVLSRGHDRLSTYNIGGEFSHKAWQYLARQFIQQGLLVQDMEHGSLRLTPQAYAIFKGEAVFGTLPDQPQRVTAVAAPHDPALFQQLRAQRKVLADAENVPPYIIFSDRSLAEMATYYPQSSEAFAAISGVGTAKLAKYADIFLPIIRAYCAAEGKEERRKTAVAMPARSSRSRTEEVAALFNEGQPIPAIAQTFRIKESTVIGHLWKAAQAGQPLRAQGVAELSQLAAAAQAKVLALFAQLGVERLRPVYDAMQGAVSYEELHLLRLHYILNRQATDEPT